MYKKEILDLFIKQGYVKKNSVDEILDKCVDGIKVAEVIIKEGFCTPEEALEVMGQYYGLPISHMDSQEIDYKLLDLIPRKTIETNKFLPVSIDEAGIMTIAICDPADIISLSALKAIYDGKIKFVLADKNQLTSKIQSLVATNSTSSALRDLNENTAEVHNSPVGIEEIQNAPAVKLVDSLINEAITYRASDIHIEPFDKSVRVRFRIDGGLYERGEFPIESYSAICARLKILAGINIAERRLPQDGRINMSTDSGDFDFRVSTMPTVYGEKLAVRILDKNAFAFTRSDLGFTPTENKVVDKILTHSHGIVLLTGPTGCGKTTTLYSFLKELNKIDVNIVTVEDPVEYTLPGINQTQVNPKANMTFANALRSILRQDPNIIMIGEIRDEETAQIAIRAAITGHLVLSTLHTNDAPGSINRLIDMGVPTYLVSDAVVGIIAQRLIKRLCPHCKTAAMSTPNETEILGLEKPVNIYHSVGCPFCNYTGYKGRTAVHEIMYLNDEIRLAINKHAYLENLRELSIKNGMTPLWDACKQLVFDGITTINELMSLFNG